MSFCSACLRPAFGGGLLLFAVGCGEVPARAVEAAVLEITDVTVLSRDDVPDILDAIPGPNGSVWTLSSFAPHVARIPAGGGAAIASFGAQGEGPGELRNPWYLVAHPEGVAVHDVGARQVKIFSAEGEFFGEVGAPAPGAVVIGDYRSTNFGEPLRVQRLADAWVFETYAEGVVAHPGGLWHGRLVTLPDGASSLETLVQYDSLRSDPIPDGWQLFPMAPLWTTCGTDGIALLNPLDSTVLSIDAGGEGNRRHIPLELPAFDDGILTTYVGNMIDMELREQNVQVSEEDREMAERMALEEMRESAPALSPPTRILCDGGARLWVAGFGIDDDVRGYGRTWQVFEGDTRMGSVTFPSRVIPLYFEGDRIIGIQADDMDVERLVSMENPMH